MRRYLIMWYAAPRKLQIVPGVMAEGFPHGNPTNKASISSEGSFVHEDQTFGSRCSAWRPVSLVRVSDTSGCRHGSVIDDVCRSARGARDCWANLWHRHRFAGRRDRWREDPNR